MISVTREALLADTPDYERDRISRLLSGAATFTALDILRLDGLPGDRLGLVMRHEMIPYRLLFLFAYGCRQRMRDTIPAEWRKRQDTLSLERCFEILTAASEKWMYAVAEIAITVVKSIGKYKVWHCKASLYGAMVEERRHQVGCLIWLLEAEE